MTKGQCAPRHLGQLECQRPRLPSGHDARELELGLPKQSLPVWDVTITVPMDPDRDNLVPDHPPLPAGVIGAWCRKQFEAGGALRAADLGEATDLASKAFRQWLALPGAKLVVRPTAPAPVG